MITFRETLDGLQNVSELLKTALEAEGAVQRNLASLADLRAMLESPAFAKRLGPSKCAITSSASSCRSSPGSTIRCRSAPTIVSSDCGRRPSRRNG